MNLFVVNGLLKAAQNKENVRRGNRKNWKKTAKKTKPRKKLFRNNNGIKLWEKMVQHHHQRQQQ